MKRLIDFSKFCSVKIGGAHEVLVINSLDDEVCGAMIGGGNNLLISPNPPQMSMLGENFNYIELNGEILEIGAATKSGQIYNFAKKQDIAGFEFLKNIPGTLGGMIKMNAGLCGISISDDLLCVLLKGGWRQKENFAFGYRTSGISEPIYAAKFKISRGFSQEKADLYAAKRKNQPSGASFGSCFTNPVGDYAGRLLEAVGLKGYAVGGAKFSEQHANFLINFNRATFEDAKTLIDLARERVLKEFGAELKTEVVIL